VTFVLDTNTLIYFFRGDGRVADRLLATPPTDIALPAIVLYELETGIAKSSAPQKRRRQLDRFLPNVSILPFGPTQARASAQLRAHLEAAGTPIGPMDTLLAGTALSHRATLVTRNVREFARVPGLPVENWYE
jgi:tRNA(fMet)-specific endonuclease VapC